jgi:hypothetical protein
MMMIVKPNELKNGYRYTCYIVDSEKNLVRKGVFLYEGMDGDDYLFKRADEMTASKMFQIMLVPKEVIDRYEFHFHKYESNGLCEMPDFDD